MFEGLAVDSRKTTWWRIIGIVLVLALLAGCVPVPPPAPAEELRVQPQLLQIVTEQPEAVVSVIVQKNPTGADDVEEMVPALGGVITKDLHIINAFAAELPAKAVLELARADGVRWVSLDAPIVSTDAANPVFVTWASEAGEAQVTVPPLVAPFKAIPIAAGHTIWFNSVLRVKDMGSSPTTIRFTAAQIQLQAGSRQVAIPAPDASITFSPEVDTADTRFDSAANTWVTTVPSGYAGDVFLSGFALPVPITLATQVAPQVEASWSGQFTTDTPGVSVEWGWSAAVYSMFSSDYNALGVKPISGGASLSSGADQAGTPENFKQALVPGALGDGDANYTGDFYRANALTVGFAQTDAMLGPVGDDDVFGYGSNAVGAFTGFAAEITPGYAIGKVEVVLRAYAPELPEQDATLRVLVRGESSEKILNRELFAPNVGPSNAGLVTLDITDLRQWRWADFDHDSGLTLEIDQRDFPPDRYVYYDAVGLRVTGVPGDDPSAGEAVLETLDETAIDSTQQVNVYNDVIGAQKLWNDTRKLRGTGVSIAVVDSGVFPTRDLARRVRVNVNFNQSHHTGLDRYGHGTFVAGIVAGDGKSSNRKYVGVAPRSFLINVRVSDDQGMATESDVVAGLQWVYEHSDKYSIRVVNLSLNSSVATPYYESPLDAAVEILWFNGITVVVSAGNNGTATLYPPANDPFVITVGATADQGTADRGDDTLASFSAYGVTEAGHAKPDLVVPGKDIIGLLPRNSKLTMGIEHPDHQIDDTYFRMSGTSTAAPMVSGAVALLLQDEPELTPDQVKYRLMATARRDWPGYDPEKAGAGYLDIYAAVYGTTLERANQGVVPHMLLARMALIAAWASQNGGDAIDWEHLDWSSVNWNSVNWNSVNWNSVNWNSVNWNSVNWNSVNWNSVNWNSVNWNSVNWNSVNWNSVNWNSVNWNSVNWNSVNWNSDYWGD